MTDPVVKVDVGSLTSSLAQGARTAVKEAAQEGLSRAERGMDSAAMQAVQEAERQAAADGLRKETDEKAERIVDEASRRAESLLAAARQEGR